MAFTTDSKLWKSTEMKWLIGMLKSACRVWMVLFGPALKAELIFPIP